MNGGIIWCPHCGKPHPLGTKVCPTSARTLERGVHAPANLPHPLVGTTIAGKYLIHRVIGVGGLGEVFEAENRMLRRMVAVKVVRGAKASPEAIARLEREALLVSAVQHPNICDVYDAGALSDGSPFIVLERLFGETLAQLLPRRRALPVPMIADVFTQMLSGLQAAHGARIVHRDLKPANVFLADRLGCPPLVKLLDFGLARDVTGLRARTITKPGALLGTLKYMSPEQLKAEHVTERSDLFAVGVMLYEALTGVHPFEGPTMSEFQRKILSVEHVPLADRRPGLPSGVAELVEKSLALLPEDRFESAVAMQGALARAFGLTQGYGDSLPPSDSVPSSSVGN